MFTKVRVSLTRLCEMSCIYCPRGPLINMENYDGEESYCMSAEEFLGILKVMSQHGLKDVHFTGGEPLLRKDLINLIKQTTSLGMNVELNTNGLGLTRDKVEHLKEVGVSLLKISLDAPNRGLFLTFTGVDAFERVVDGVRIATSIIPVRLNCVVMKSNVKFIIPLIELVNNLGVKQIHFLDLTYYPCLGGKTFWEREFVYLTKEVMPLLKRRFGSTFQILPVYGCRFYKMEQKSNGTTIILKEAQPTMRFPDYCDNCQEYCHEGVFTLRLSAGGLLNFCPCNNLYSVNALKLYQKNKLGEALQKYSLIFDQVKSADSFQVFLERNELSYNPGGNQ